LLDVPEVLARDEAKVVRVVRFETAHESSSTGFVALWVGGQRQDLEAAALRIVVMGADAVAERVAVLGEYEEVREQENLAAPEPHALVHGWHRDARALDRKSTRLNSSH